MGKPLSLPQNPYIAVSQGLVLRVHESHTTHRARHEVPSSRAAARPEALRLRGLRSNRTQGTLKASFLSIWEGKVNNLPRGPVEWEDAQLSTDAEGLLLSSGDIF